MSDDRLRLRLLVDGDSCPVPVRALLTRAAARRGFSLRFLANRPLPVDAGAELEVVSGESVDELLLREVIAGIGAGRPVVVVTRDIPLAERVIAAGAVAINDRGTEFDAATVAKRRSERDAAELIRASGLEEMRRTRSFGAREQKAFADTLDRVLTRLGY